MNVKANTKTDHCELQNLEAQEMIFISIIQLMYFASQILKSKDTNKV